MTEASTSDSLLGQPIRRHWIALVWRAWIPGVLTLVLWLATIAVIVGGLGIAPDLGLAIGLGLLVLSLASAAWAAFIYYDWTNDYLTITRDQITHYEQELIFSQRTQVVPVRQVQNVGVYIPNPLYGWLNIGHIFIDTAGQEGAIRFYTIRDPRSIQSMIFELLGRPVPIRIAPTPSSRFERFLPIFPVRTERGGLVWHRHWWVLLRRIFWSLLLNLGLPILLGLGLLAGAQVGLPFLLELDAIMTALLVLIWLAAALGSWYIYEDWKNDFWIITDTHIIDIVAKPFPISTEERRQARLEDIVDVRTSVLSLFDRLINKGDVFAETAGKAQNFNLEEVRDPRSIQDEIFRRRTAARARAAQSDAEKKKADDAEMTRRVVEIVLERLGQPVPPAAPPGSK
jgi:hypothetical protein